MGRVTTTPERRDRSRMVGVTLDTGVTEVTFLGVGAVVAATGNTQNPAYHGGYSPQADDFGIICMAGWLSAIPPVFSAPGWSLMEAMPAYDTTNGVTAWFLYKKLTAGEAAPTVTSSSKIGRAHV